MFQKETVIRTAAAKMHSVFLGLTAMVWFLNGFVCKVLNLVPRHQQIVARILGSAFADILTILIGLAEIVMGFWILSRYRKKLNAVTQMVLVGTMNVLEFILAPDLLLWGRFNAIFAFCFILFVYYNEFHLGRRPDVKEPSFSG